MTARIDGRTPKDLRDIKVTRQWLSNAEGSTSGKGWVTSE